MKNINDLRGTLYEAMQLLKEGKIDVNQAQAISGLGQTIINSAKIELEFIKEVGGTGSGFIEVEQPKRLERPKAEYTNQTREKLIDKYAS
jgi:K+-transporting ATPase A subunit